jgi:hypothetical protein
MNRHPTDRTAGLSRGGNAVPGWAYVFFCVSTIFVMVFLTVAGFYLPPRVFPSTQMQVVLLPVARIQLSSNRDGQCRHLIFHNDTGRFEDDGTGRCHGLIAEELLVNSIQTDRSAALARVFKLR